MLTIEVTRRPDLSEWEAALTAGAENAMPAVAEVLREAAELCFATETDPWGQPWPPRRHASESRGVLRGSLVATPAAPAPGLLTATVRPGPEAAAYAAIQQVRRPFLPVRGGVVDMPETLRERLITMMRDAIRAELVRRGVGSGT